MDLFLPNVTASSWSYPEDGGSIRHLWQGQQINPPLKRRSSVVSVRLDLFIWLWPLLILTSNTTVLCILHFLENLTLPSGQFVVWGVRYCYQTEPVCPAVSRHVPSSSGLSRHVGPPDWRGPGRRGVRGDESSVWRENSHRAQPRQSS